VKSQSVPSPDLGNRLGGSPLLEATYLFEEAFHTCRADDLKDYCLDVMHDATWLKEEPALLNYHHAPTTPAGGVSTRSIAMSGGRSAWGTSRKGRGESGGQ
jgi:hypothetical protein